MIAVVSKIYLMKHCDTLITLTENLGRGWEADWLVQTSHFPCPVFPAPAPFLASSLKPLCKAAIIKMIVTLFYSISPASHPFIIITSRPFLSLPLNLQATYSPGLPPPCASLQDWISDDICNIFWKLDQTLPTLSFILSFTLCVRLRIEFSFGFSGLWLIPLIRKSSLYPIVFQDLDEKSLFSQSGSCFHSFACVSWCIH